MTSDQCDAYFTGWQGKVYKCLKQKYHGLPHVSEDTAPDGSKYNFTWRA